MTTKFVKPKPGCVVVHPMTSRNPQLRRLADEGEEVTWNSWWQRRFDEGALEIVEPEKKKPARKSKQPTTTEED